MSRLRWAEGAKEVDMARVSTYLNFQGQTEEAFTHYARVFGTEIEMLTRYSTRPERGRQTCQPRSRIW